MVQRTWFALVGMLLGAVGCSAPAQDDVSGTGGSAVSSSGEETVAERIASCEREAEDRIASAESTMERVSASRATASCFRAVVDGQAGELDRMRGRTAGMSGRFFAAFRDYDRAAPQSPRLCEVLRKASPMFGGSEHPVETASCAAEHERSLAGLLAAHVDGPGRSSRSPAGANGGSTADRNRVVTALVRQMLDNLPVRDTEDERAAARQEIVDAIDAVEAASEMLCDLFADADPTRDGAPSVREKVSACRADARARLDSRLLSYTTEP